MFLEFLTAVKVWTVLLAYGLALWPAGFLIGALTNQWRDQLEAGEGLKKAGLWIGCLERFLVVTFVLLNHYEAIGFLVAAKSIFRFGEIRDSSHRKEAEYILIGTMLSFAIAIVIGIALRWVLRWGELW
jgi:hypothetical protein